MRFAKRQAKSAVVMKLNRNGKSNIHYVFSVVFFYKRRFYSLNYLKGGKKQRRENTISILFSDMNRIGKKNAEAAVVEERITMNKIWFKMKNFIILAGYQHGAEMSRLALPSHCDVQPFW